jgi:hypothetical protein
MNNWEYLLVFHAYINEMHGSRSKIPSKKSRPYIYDLKFLALLGAPYVYDISRLRVKFNGRITIYLTRSIPLCVITIGTEKYSLSQHVFKLIKPEYMSQLYSHHQAYLQSLVEIYNVKCISYV